MKSRSAYVQLIERLAFANDKMAFLTGPRQVGKTTLAQGMLAKQKSDKYFNWDDVAFRREWLKDPKALIPVIVGEKSLVVFDELHKAPRWKTYLKGVFDMRKEHAHILVTGSARLDIFRRGGDSLLGRYFLFRLHPFSIGEMELTSAGPDQIADALKERLPSKNALLKSLLEHGGFPEPFLKADGQFTNLWRRMRTERLIREDLLDLTRTHELALIEGAVALLPARVGSLFSLQSLAGDIEISHPTAKRWIEWLSQLYYVYLIRPYGKNVARNIKKQPKLYLWDWSEVPDPAARFENLVANHLLKAVHFWTDSGLGKFDLSYIRDKEKREVDFLVLRDGKPWLMAECKSGDVTPSPHLRHFASLLNPAIVLQIVEKSGIQEWFDIDRKEKGQTISADAFLGLLP